MPRNWARRAAADLQEAPRSEKKSKIVNNKVRVCTIFQIAGHCPNGDLYCTLCADQSCKELLFL